MRPGFEENQTHPTGIGHSLRGHERTERVNLKGKKKALHGLVGAIGAVAAAGGFNGAARVAGTLLAAIVLSFAIWAIGATLVNVIAD